MSTTRIKQPRRDLNLYLRSEPQNPSSSLSMSSISSDSSLRGIEYILCRLGRDESLDRHWSSRRVRTSKGSNSRGRASGSTTAKKALICLCQKAAALACWTRPCGISIDPYPFHDAWTFGRRSCLYLTKPAHRVYLMSRFWGMSPISKNRQ